MTSPYLAQDHDLIGGIPAVLGPWQLDLLIEHGMLPSHTLLDLGCGTLRLGLLALEYLDPDQYLGIDPGQELLKLGRGLAEQAKTLDRARAVENLDWLDAQEPLAVDFVMTQSVLNHLDVPAICETVDRVTRHLGPRGGWLGTASFDPTLTEVRVGRPHPRRLHEFVHTRMPPQWFASELALRGLEVQRLAKEHPRGLHPFVARRKRTQGNP